MASSFSDYAFNKRSRFYVRTPIVWGCQSNGILPWYNPKGIRVIISAQKERVRIENIFWYCSAFC